jgi:UDPglucose 6-dehydrogenase
MLGDTIEYAKDQYDALIDVDALLIVTEWPEFRSPNFKVVGRLMKDTIIFDGRNIYDVKEMEEAGFTYYGIGVKPHYHSTIDIA